jgi:hypothetical protein
MGNDSAHIVEKPASRKRLPRWLIYLAAMTVTSCLAAGCIGTIAIALFFSAMGTETTEADFKTDAQSVQFLNSIIPLAIPANATNVQFTQQGFQDRHIDATFTLPPGDVEPFIQSLPPLDQPKPNHYVGEVGYTHLSVEVDPGTGVIHLIWFET